MSDTSAGESQLHFLDYWRVIRVRLPLIFLIFMLVLLTAGIITYLSPKKYAASVTMQVRQEDYKFQVFGSEQRGSDPRFLPTQFEIMQRKEMLYPVVDAMDLVSRWSEEGINSKEIAYAKLRSMLSMRDIRNTDLIQITCTSTNPQEAAEIANSVAEEYKKKRMEEVQMWADRSLGTLREEVDKQKIKVEQLRAEAARIRVENDIQDLNPDSIEDVSSPETRSLLSTEETVTAQRNRVASLEARYAQIGQLTDEQIMRSISLLEINDATIVQTLPQYDQIESELSRLLNAGLGPNHPTIKSLQAQGAKLKEQLLAQIAALRTNLLAALEAERASLASLEEQLSGRQATQQDSRSKQVEYIQAKLAYINAKKVLDSAELRLSTEMLDRVMPMNPAIIWERAEPNNSPVSPKVRLNMLLAVVVGLVFGVGFAFFLEYLDTSVKTMEDVENLLGVPVVGVIRKGISILFNEPDDNPDAEAYRIMRTNVEFTRKSPEANTITMVSGGPGEGKSTTIANLAYTFAKGQQNVLIIDTDLRRPSQHRIFGMENKQGLSDYLTSEIDLEEVIQETPVPQLYLLPSGRLPSDAAGILNSQKMMQLIADVKTRFDFVFFDSPPILGVSDASVISSAVDLTMIVVQHRRYPKSMLKRVKGAIDKVGGTILGVVLNNVNISHDEQYEYYTSYYNYYATPSKQEKKDRKEEAKRRKKKEKTKTAQALEAGSRRSDNEY